MLDRTKNFIEKSNNIHNNFYDYSKLIYTGANKKSIIICPTHGEFEQRPNDHIRGFGCKKCSYDKMSNINASTKEMFVNKANIKYNSKFDYSKFIYKNSSTESIIICPHHGEFSQTPSNHIRCSTGCKDCGKELYMSSLCDNTKDFIKKSKLLHGDKFDYSKVDYVNSKVKVNIVCDKGHIFSQSPNDHLGGHGCNICTYDTCFSSHEKEVLSYIKSICEYDVLENNRTLIAPYEVDIFIPELSIAIEYNGLYWHSEINKNQDYHYIKHRLCVDKNIRLITIWEHEWLHKNELCKSFLKSLVVQPNKLYARKLLLKLVDVDEQKMFLNKFHFQGYSSSSLCYGLYNNNTLIQLMSLKKLNKNNDYEIGRLCTFSGFVVVGGSEKLFKALKSSVLHSSIISYNNLEKFTGNVYDKLGMKLLSDRLKSYFYTDNKNAFSRQKFQKHKLIKQGFDSNMTETEITKSLGYNKVFPVGSSKYVL